MGALERPSFRFASSTVVTTPGARIAIGAAGQRVEYFVHKHWSGDWGEVSEADKQANENALVAGYSVLSVFRTDLRLEIWLITDAKRKVTTVLTPNEY